MDAWRYGIYLLVFTFDISLVRCAHSFDIECEHEKINSISPSVHVLFCLLYKHTDDGVSDDFPKISDHLPKISEDFSNCPEDQTNVPPHFSVVEILVKHSSLYNKVHYLSLENLGILYRELGNCKLQPVMYNYCLFILSKEQLKYVHLSLVS